MGVGPVRLTGLAAATLVPPAEMPTVAADMAPAVTRTAAVLRSLVPLIVLPVPSAL
jgi:hypothetical protein